MNRALVYNAFEFWDCLVMASEAGFYNRDIVFVLCYVSEIVCFGIVVSYFGDWFGRVGRLELLHQLQLQ